MIEAEVGRILRERGLTLAVAESCTGGLLSSLITDVPGSSDYFRGGIVAYSNAVKERVLGVPGDVLATVGAVSAECARAMAEGVRGLLKADIGIATTGIAGPGGGTPTKPVGLVYIALAHAGGVLVREFRFVGARRGNKHSAAHEALRILHDFLRG
ncbi:MAG: CinA family protein [Caldiserica bacterium]|nr:CinA family protein [Caldisericota bacterium]